MTTRQRLLTLTALLAGAALLACAPALTEDGPATGQGTSSLSSAGIKFMTYNIKHGELSSLDSIANVIKAQAPDLVALQEVDVLTTRSGEVDQPARLGQLTGMYHAFQPSLPNYDTGQYGLALLSKFPIRTSQRYLLRSSGEQRILAVMEVEIDPQHIIPVAITHFGTTGSTERLNQAEDVKAILANKPWALLGGDLNATPSEASIGSLLQLLTDAWARGGSGSGYTHPANFPSKRIDYILLGSAWTSTVTASVVSATSQSDHRPVVATVGTPWNQTLFGNRLPGTAVQSDTRAVEVGVKFRSNVPGTIKALRFYRGTGNSSGYVARLWTGTGTLLASVNAKDGVIPGWQEVALPTPVSISANTTYIASYYTSNGQFARDVYGLTNAVNSGNLSALASGASGGNGVYLYATGGGFPNRTYNDTNYWVDVVFSPAQ